MINAAADAAELTLFSRHDCLLCDALVAELERWDGGRGLYRLTIIDIDTDPGLRERYGLRIPVLLRGTSELCAGRLHKAALAALEPST